MGKFRIKSALISVFNKDGITPLVEKLNELNVKIYSTGGTKAHIEGLGVSVHAVESLTAYPSILGGRVKTLHPKIFGGILAQRTEDHLNQLATYQIPEIDLVIVDLYPFEETVASTDKEEEIIEKIDIGGIALIRAAAKNFKDVLVVPSRKYYDLLLQWLTEKPLDISEEDRKYLAKQAFGVSSHYDTAIFNYFQRGEQDLVFKESQPEGQILRYGENPHQKGVFYGTLEKQLDKLNGKALSYNNLVDIDAAIAIMAEFEKDDPTFAVLKHTNTCGLATRQNITEAWSAALAGDNISAFGGILIANRPIDEATANSINSIFYEVLIAPDFEESALRILMAKKNRIILKIAHFDLGKRTFKNLLNGVIEQDMDLSMEEPSDWRTVTKKEPLEHEIKDLLFANKCVKHLKSNGIALIKNQQLVGMGCGQTSRVDALKQAIEKAKRFGFELDGAVMASDAFFPFPDCVEIADEAGIKAVIQPGGSKKDQDSIDYCDAHHMSMVMTGVRHFKH